jgi:hypothetical protein
MLNVSESDCIRCFFGYCSKIELKSYSDNIEVYYAVTNDLISMYSFLKNYVRQEELFRSENFTLRKTGKPTCYVM